MGSQAQAPGVGDALAVAEQQVRPDVEPFHRRQYGRDFAEGKQPRHIGEAGRQASDGRGFELQRRKCEHRDGGARRGAIALEADIHAGDAGDRAEVVTADDFRGQARLHRHGLLWRQVPGVALMNPHRSQCATTSGTNISSALTPPCTPSWR